jgi:anaerobic ribonucleoside-triphosphate reductase activating protein
VQQNTRQDMPKAQKLMIRLAAPPQSDSIVDGEGLRTVIWTQGCRRHCPGCHNPETWSEEDGVGKLVEVEEIKRLLDGVRMQAGITFSGGEPFLQPEACGEIARYAKEELGLNVWSFTGYTYEQLREEGGVKWTFLKQLDVLIDGPFVLAERDISLRFRGSRNQRLLRLRDGAVVGVE